MVNNLGEYFKMRILSTDLEMDLYLTLYKGIIN